MISVKLREDNEIKVQNDAYGVMTAPDTVRLERLLPGPIERVWACLTQSELRGRWLASGEMELRVGGRVELKFHNTQLSAHPESIPEKYAAHCADGVGFVGRVTQCDPPRLLSYTWGGSKDGKESEVTFELTPAGKDVRLALTHRRLADRKEMVSVASGWHTHVDILIDQLNGRASPGFWSTHTKWEAEYEKRIEP